MFAISQRTAAPLAVLVCLMTGHASAEQKIPVRKAGLWEVRLRPVGPSAQAEQKVLQCTDRASDHAMLFSIVPGQENCKSELVQQRAGTLHISTTCAVHQNQVQAEMQIDGSMQSQYQGRFNVRYAQPISNSPVPTQFRGRWLGACPDNMRPGNMQLPNGILVNVLEQAHGHEHETNASSH